jgi:hypothetical protein
VFVLTVDQVGSRTSPDLVPTMTAELRQRLGTDLLLGPDRTAGDEFELVLATGATVLAAVLHLHRSGRWSAGVGVGPVDQPLPPTAREGRGEAFVRARAAVEAAKRAPHRIALAAPGGGLVDGPGVQALLDLLLDVRARRSAEGWEAAELLAELGSQAAVATRLGITPQAVSLRVRAAGLREEQAALPALAALLDSLDGAAA